MSNKKTEIKKTGTRFKKVKNWKIKLKKKTNFIN
jgi:hypothetical protein